jgi:hypothetical protein
MYSLKNKLYIINQIKTDKDMLNIVVQSGLLSIVEDGTAISVLDCVIFSVLMCQAFM